MTKKKVSNDKKCDIKSLNVFRKLKNSKNNSFNIIEVFFIMIISLLFGVVSGICIVSSKYKYPSEIEEFIQTYENIVNNYYEKVDKKNLINAATKGMINSLDDDYSVYMDAEETEDFNTNIDGNYGGIGAVVSKKEDKNIIVQIFDSSPSKKAGLKVGDVFLKVNGKDVSKLSLEELTDKIKGKVGTKVKITVLRDNKEVEISVKRGNVEIPYVSNKILNKNNKKIGYISISLFSASTYNQFNNALKKIEKENIDGLIIDLRDNPGGHLSDVTSMLSLFLPKDKVVYQLETNSKKEKIYSLTNESRNYKVSVLINESSASASEIMAACFKESYDNAFIVGVNSYGKGTVQQAVSLSSGSSFKFTIQKWLTPKGNWINKKGVTPDVKVELNEEYFKNPIEENDNQLQSALDIVTK